MAVVTRGSLELSLRLEMFPKGLRDKLEVRIRELTATLDERIEAVTPKGKTGDLRSEIKANIYTEGQNRVAGYVSVFAPTNPAKEYPKAATLEYGSDKARKLRARLSSARRRLEQRLTKAVHIEARRFIRGPFVEMQPEIRAALDEVMAEQLAEGEI